MRISKTINFALVLFSIPLGVALNANADTSFECPISLSKNGQPIGLNSELSGVVDIHTSPSGGNYEVVKVSVDDTNICNNRTSCPWDTSQFQNGRHTIYCRAVQIGNTTTRSVDVAVLNDTPAPPRASLDAEVTPTRGEQGQTFSFLVTLSNYAPGSKKFNLYVDEVLKDTKSFSSPRNNTGFSINDVGIGEHLFRVDALEIDALSDSDVAASSSGTFIIDGDQQSENLLQHFDILSSRNPMAMFKSVKLEAEISPAAVDIDEVKFVLDGERVIGRPDTRKPFRARLQTTRYADGEHTITAIATKDGNVIGETSLQIYIDNQNRKNIIFRDSLYDGTLIDKAGEWWGIADNFNVVANGDENVLDAIDSSDSGDGIFYPESSYLHPKTFSNFKFESDILFVGPRDSSSSERTAYGLTIGSQEKKRYGPNSRKRPARLGYELVFAPDSDGSGVGTLSLTFKDWSKELLLEERRVYIAPNSWIRFEIELSKVKSKKVKIKAGALANGAAFGQGGSFVIDHEASGGFKPITSGSFGFIAENSHFLAKRIRADKLGRRDDD